MSDEVMLWIARKGEGSDSTLLKDTVTAFRELANSGRLDISQVPETTLELLARGLLALDSDNCSLSSEELSNSMIAALFAFTWSPAAAHPQIVQTMQEKMRARSGVRKTSGI